MTSPAWFAINEAYSAEFEAMQQDVTKQVAPSVRFGVRWEDDLEDARRAEIQGLDEYLDLSGQAAIDELEEALSTERLIERGLIQPGYTDEEYKSCSEMDEGIRLMDEARERVRQAYADKGE